MCRHLKHKGKRFKRICVVLYGTIYTRGILYHYIKQIGIREKNVLSTLNQCEICLFRYAYYIKLLLLRYISEITIDCYFLYTTISAGGVISELYLD